MGTMSCFAAVDDVWGGDLVAAIAEPAAGREVEGTLGACGYIGETKLAMAVHPGASHDHIVRRAIRRHQAEHLTRLTQLYP